MSGGPMTERDEGLGPRLDLSGRFESVQPGELFVRSYLGGGAQAQVYKAQWMRVFALTTSSITVAVKRLNADLSSICRDREVLSMMIDHQNLVKCFDCTDSPPYLIVSEFCAGGSLFDVLYNSSVKLEDRQAVKILSDVAAGMNFLHSQRPVILHRDLKSSNILLMKPVRCGTQVPVAKVADFGLARLCGESDAASMTVGVGTWRWMAPEVFQGSDSDTYDKQADVYSYGMTMYELGALKVPFADKYPEDLNDPRISLFICRGMRPEVPADWRLPQALQCLMTSLWDSDPFKRPEFDQINSRVLGVLDSLPDPAVFSDGCLGPALHGLEWEDV